MKNATNKAVKGTNKEVIGAVETTTAPAAEVIQKQPEVQAAPVSEAAPAATAEVIQAPAAVSKAQVANAIFKQMFGMQQVPARKDMIKAAMTQAGLTEKGAATYLQNYKSKNGLVKKAVATA